VGLRIAGGAKAPEIAEYERQIRPLATGLDMVDPRRARRRDIATTDDAAETVALQRFQPQRAPSSSCIKSFRLFHGICLHWGGIKKTIGADPSNRLVAELGR
jgi:hypothetical protein